MPLRRRLLMLFLPLMLISLGAVWLLSQHLLLQRFDQLDAEQLAESANQLHRELHQQMSNLLTLSRDWAWWDESYQFVAGQNEDYIASNLNTDTLDNLGLHFILIYDDQGRLFEELWHLPAAEELPGLPLPRQHDPTLLKLRTLSALARAGFNKPRQQASDSLTEWFALDRRPLLATSTPISNSSGQRLPNGSLVMGFFITHEWKKTLENRLLQQLQIEDNPSAPGNAFVLDISAKHLNSMAWLTPRQVSGEHQATRLSMVNQQREAALTLLLDRSRPIYRQGQQVTNLFFIGMLLILVLASCIGYLGLELWVLRRLLLLNQQIGQIGQDNQLDRLSLEGRDELGQLAGEINHMLERVEQSESRDLAILNNIQDGFFELDINGRVLTANPALEKMLGYPSGALENMDMLQALSPEDASRARQLFREAIRGDGNTLLSVPLQRRNGSYGHFEGRFSVIHDSKGTLLGYRGIVRDVSGQVALQNQLLELAYRDTLTGLGNRKAFLEQLKLALDEADRLHRSLALFYIDLDRFKEVNDRFGHEAGDELLTQIAERLRNSLRAPDRVYRLGGDEFTLLMPGGTLDSSQRLAARLLTALHEPIYLKQVMVDFVTPSIGIALYPEHASEAATLISAADAAMYQAKQQRNRACVYESDLLSPAAENR